MVVEFTFCEDTVSDLHKDAYGFRPCQNWWADWQSSNPVGKQQIWDELIVAFGRSVEEDNARETEAIIRFETAIDALYACGAKDRETALRWCMEASDCKGDWDYFAWQNGLPYSYVRGMK